MLLFVQLLMTSNCPGINLVGLLQCTNLLIIISKYINEAGQFHPRPRFSVTKNTYCGWLYSKHTTTLLHIQNRPTSPHRYLCSFLKGNTYLYIFISKFFDPDTVPLKWDPVQLLNGHVVLYQNVSDSGNAYSIYVVEYLPICKYLLL